MSSYTYVDGRKVLLRKDPGAFVARADRRTLEAMALGRPEQMSSASHRVAVAPGSLDREMDRLRSRSIVAHHAYRTVEGDRPFLVTDRVVVSFEAPPSDDQVQDLVRSHALQVVRRLTDRDYVFRLTDDTGMNPVKLVVMLTESARPGIRAVNHDRNRIATVAAPHGNGSIARAIPPADPAFARQWHLHDLMVHPEVDRRSSTRCLQAWTALGHFGSADIVIGVADDGCRLDHPDFDGPDKFAGWAYMEGDTLIHDGSDGADRGRMYQPGADHGTSCAGVIAAEPDGTLTVGAAAGCRLLPVKWESGDGKLFVSDSKLATVLDHVGDKVDILSCSWAGGPDSVWPSFLKFQIRRLAETGGRRGRGLLFVWAAGNGNCPLHHQGDMAIPWTNGWARDGNGERRWVGVETSRSFFNNMIDIPGVLHVAALASTARRSHYSNYGRGISLCAPSSNRHTYKRSDLPGLRIATASGAEDDGVTDAFGGTSSAAPLVAGIAGLVLSADPALSAIEVAEILMTTASRDLDFTPYDRTSPEPYDPDPAWDVSPIAPFDSGAFDDAGWSAWFGCGRVDAEAAVNEALRRRRTGPDADGRDSHDNRGELAGGTSDHVQ